SGIGTLTELETLYLDNTAVTDLSPLSALPKLRTLSLDRTAVTDLSPLLELEEFDCLFIRGCEISEEQVNAIKEKFPDCYIYN
ncbi:MAG: leucine-rich repeat domain-containing protein, partial [Ruminiclostridium sp.]|nr:leucine-rich repeat domain-containing protein [Ruminiclostridium sp.]